MYFDLKLLLIIPSILFNMYMVYSTFKQLSSFRGTLVNLVKLLFKLVLNVLYGVPNKTRWLSFLQLSVFIEYAIVFFYLYHPLGRLVFIYSIILFFNGLVYAPYWFAVLIIFFITSPIAASLTLYFLVQFEKVRLLLIEVIGQENFSIYVGNNPGTTQIKKLGGVVGISISLAILADFSNKGSQVIANHLDGNNYVETCNKANVPVNEATLSKIYSAKAPSVVEFFFGRK